MEEIKIKRPPSVWITQVLLLVLTLFFLWLTLSFVRIELGLVGDAGLTPVFWVSCLGIASMCLFSFWSLAKRKTYGRWLSAIVLLLFLGLSASMPLPILLLIVGLFVFLICQLAFGTAANAFFAKPSSGE